jgi:tetratricopeptide (TPR) repeat protein
MWRRPSLLGSVPLLLVLLTSSYAQRDRDTYNPGNQTFEVSGQVNVAGSNAAARDVPVRLERFSGGVIDQITTDGRGRFRFGNLQRGYYKVIISAPGFVPSQQDADLTVLFKAYLVFTLASSESPANARGLSTEVLDARVPASARDEFAHGREALARKSYPEAIAHLQKALGFYPEFFEAQLLLGTAYMDLRDWPNAETAMLRSLEIRTDNGPAMLGLGEVYWREKRYPEAEKTLRDGLKLDENNWHGHFTLARLYWDQGDALKAGPCLGRTLQLKPDFAEAHLLAGNVLLKVGQQQRATVEYEEYLRLAPKGEYAGEARTLVEKLHKLNDGTSPPGGAAKKPPEQ